MLVPPETPAGSVTLGPPPRAELCRARRSRADGAPRALLVRAPRGGVARQAAPHHQTDLVHRGATFAFVTRAPVRQRADWAPRPRVATSWQRERAGPGGMAAPADASAGAHASDPAGERRGAGGSGLAEGRTGGRRGLGGTRAAAGWAGWQERGGAGSRRRRRGSRGIPRDSRATGCSGRRCAWRAPGWWDRCENLATIHEARGVKRRRGRRRPGGGGAWLDGRSCGLWQRNCAWPNGFSALASPRERWQAATTKKQRHGN